MKQMLLSLLILLASVTAIGIEPMSPLPDVFCQSFKMWKQAMQKKHPTVDRSVPGVAKLCMIKDD